MIETYKHYFAAEVAKHIDLGFEEIMALIEIPPENIPGDLAFPCFQLAKQAKQSPHVLAQQFAEEFTSPSFTRFEAVGGYLNAHINKTTFMADFFSLKLEA